VLPEIDVVATGLLRHSPDIRGFAASVARFTGFGNGKSPLPRAKGGRGLRLSHRNAKARPICFLDVVALSPSRAVSKSHNLLLWKGTCSHPEIENRFPKSSRPVQSFSTSSARSDSSAEYLARLPILARPESRCSGKRWCRDSLCIRSRRRLYRRSLLQPRPERIYSPITNAIHIVLSFLLLSTGEDA